MNKLLLACTTWGSMLTVAVFALGTWLNRKTRKSLCNPLLLSCVLVIVFLKIYDIPYAEYRDSTSVISYLLLPATISLAIPLYEKWNLFKQNTTAILVGTFIGVLTSLGSISIMAIILKLTREQYITLLPKSVTTAIGMDIVAELGGVPTLASAVIILTGIIGGLIAETVCKVFHINNPVAKGIAIGSAAHAIGTSKAMELGKTEGAMSSLAIVVAGILTAALAPIFVSFTGLFI